MLVILARHAERAFQVGQPDAAQSLTPNGERQALELAQNLAARLQLENLQVATVLTSPYRRAVQTAERLAQPLGLAAQPVQALQTDPYGSVDEAFKLVVNVAAQGVLVVGHGPDLAELCTRLSGRRVELPVANAVALHLGVRQRGADLLWQINYKPKR